MSQRLNDYFDLLLSVLCPSSWQVSLVGERHYKCTLFCAFDNDDKKVSRGCSVFWLADKHYK